VTIRAHLPTLRWHDRCQDGSRMDVARRTGSVGHAPLVLVSVTSAARITSSVCRSSSDTEKELTALVE
jgi:hypothetical protein